MSQSIYSGPTTSATRRGGVVSLELNGEAVDVAGDLTYDATRSKREPLEGQSGPQGFKEDLKYGMMSFSIRDNAQLSQQRVMELTNIPIVAILATGKTVYGTAMTCQECGEVKTDEGTFDVKFFGYLTESSY